MDRLVELTRYFPDYLRSYPEILHTAKAEGEEIKRLYGAVDTLWNNGYIQTADYTGIKRWESLLSAKPYPGDGLEERRASVLLKWNQQLPYTLQRLRERLDAAAGEEDYEIRLDYSNYTLNLMLYPAQPQIQRMVRDMVAQMIPANILLDMGILRPPKKVITYTGVVRTEFVQIKAVPDAGQRNIKKITGLYNGVSTLEHIKIICPAAEKEV